MMPPLIEPMSSDLLAGYDAFATLYAARGYLPNNLLAMGRVPGLLDVSHQLYAIVMAERSRVTAELKVLIEHLVSGAAGCRYCQAHTAFSSERRHGNGERIAAIWDFQTSPLFSEAERAVLALAVGAGVSPSAVTDEMRATARAHWTDDELAEVVGVIAFMGFINRWNDTVATPLEDAPAAYARDTLAAHGWEIGRHG